MCLDAFIYAVLEDIPQINGQQSSGVGPMQLYQLKMSMVVKVFKLGFIVQWYRRGFCCWW